MLTCNMSMLNYISICEFDPGSNVLILNYPVNIHLYLFIIYHRMASVPTTNVFYSMCLPNPSS